MSYWENLKKKTKLFLCALMRHVVLNYIMVLKIYSTQCRELQNNNLSGLLPDYLGNMVHLQNLNLANNKFNGSIPIAWGQLSNLKHL